MLSAFDGQHRNCDPFCPMKRPGIGDLPFVDWGADRAQPMKDPDGRMVISDNGEIYNDEELRRAIERETGYPFRTKCEAKTLVAGWLAWGEGLFERLDGMFAVALWDRRHRRLILARDGVGIKPLYLLGFGPIIAFASEIKSLLPALNTPLVIASAALHSFFGPGIAAAIAVGIGGS